MATYYHWTGATGNNDGTTPTDAWTSYSSFNSVAVPGDILYTRGGETSNVSQTAVSASNNKIQIIGVNSSWVDDETIIDFMDGTSTVANGVSNTNPADYYYMKNLGVKNCTSSNWLISGHVNIFDNCSSENDGVIGFNSTTNNYFYRCKAYNGANHYYGSRNTWMYCYSENASTRGFYSVNGHQLYLGCISNGDSNGFRLQASNGDRMNMIGCVAYDVTNTGFLLETVSGEHMTGCYAEGCGTGFDFSIYDSTFAMYNYAYNNTTNSSGTPGVGSIGNNFAGTASYLTDPTNGDFTLDSDFALYSNGHDINSSTTFYLGAGINPEAGGGGGGGGGGSIFGGGIIR